ncbi:TonB-dependent receptor [Chitinophaga sp. SYP-B3965]|uniref:SusC/RagA family TonB-linked outer membrane protein n=1 Tax=Chitinophaga sp. SYP-B3965 TaxID=2663120 RepID=UPI001565438A|nr:TonB-dependent receptor [Chitinophaga sp. SYP-B3965]
MEVLSTKRRMVRWLLCLAILIAPSIHTYAQTGNVSGTVTDEKGGFLPGVTVQIKGTSLGTKTDVTGKFSLPLKTASATLVFSFIGYQTKEISTAAAGDLKITLAESASGLNEVIVVGYGRQKRQNVIGSAVQISGDQLKQAPTMNLSNALAGRLPGLTALQQSGRPGNDEATLRIRGVATYNGNQSPLVIIDGVPRSSFSSLDPNEVESITLLKDAVSTAVYGLQAANGIILVTTKRGKSGKPQISYDGGIQVTSNTRFPKFLNGPDYMTWYNKGIEMDSDYQENIGAGPVPFVYSQEQIDAVRNGTNTNPLLGNTDWVGKLVGNEAISHQHNITVRGGTDKVKYFTSAGFLDQNGVVENTGFKRYNVRSNIDAELSDIFSVSMDLGVRQTNTRTPGLSPDNDAYLNPFYQAVRMLPNMPEYAPNGLPVGYNSNAGWVNPIASVQQSGYQNGQSNIFQGNITFRAKIPWVKGLEAKVLAAYDKTSTENKSWLTPYTLMGRNRDQTTGDFTPINSLPGITRTTLRQSYVQSFRKTFQPSITYNQTFGDHEVSALALYEFGQGRNNLFSAGASNFPLTDIHEINYGGQGALDVIAPTGSSNLDSRAGYVARINYAYKGKYLVELATRYDASINFHPDYRWDYFPAAAVGWIVSKEPFFEKAKSVVDFLKLKASVGRLGNERAGSFEYLQTYQLTTDPVIVLGGKPTAAIYTSAPPNPILTWETAKVTNVGFESIFLDGKLGFDLEYFYKLTTNILASQGGLFPSTIGGYYPANVNSGIMDNRGVDLQIRYNNKIGKLEYGLTGNFNWARNKIIRKDEVPNTPEWMRQVGRPLGTKFGFEADGMYQTWEEAANAPSPSAGVVAPGFFRYKDINGDGRITRTDDFVVIGRSNLPEIMYGLNIYLKYGGFDLTALLQGAALSSVNLAGTYEGSSGTSGVDDNTPFTKSFYGYGNSPYFLVEGAWTPDNPNAEFPRLTSYKAALTAHNAHINSGWVRDGGYLRVKSMQLGYTIPASWMKQAKIQQFRVYVSGFNLFTFDKLKYLDPEMPNVNNGFYPQQRILSAGVNLSF